jgi:hypothetical protein
MNRTRSWWALVLLVIALGIGLIFGFSDGDEAPALAGLEPGAAPQIGPTLPPVVVASEPTGPPKPASGWAVVYADGFAAALGTGPGEDNTWFPSMGGGPRSSCKTPTYDCRGSNRDELQVFNSSNQSVGPEGLRLKCDFLRAGTEAVNRLSGENKKYYRCGAADGPVCCDPTDAEQSGYNAPLVKITSGATYVFQVVMQLPLNTNEADPAFWFSGPPYDGCCELDMPEATVYGEGGTGYGTQSFRWNWFAGTEEIIWGLPNDPERDFHTYTTQLAPGAVRGKWRLRVWIDGVPQTLYDKAEGCGRPPNSCGKIASREVTAPTTPNKNPLILQYAVREANGNASGGISKKFKRPGEERSMYVRSVAIYQDGAHENVGIEKPSAGVAAPNTLIAREGEAPSPPPKVGEPPVYRVAEKLKASPGAWTNSPATFAYQWQRCSATGAACRDIAGADVDIYAVAPADAGHTLRVTVRATNAQGTGEARSRATSVVKA